MPKSTKFNENSSQAFNSHSTVANGTAFRLTWLTPGIKSPSKKCQEIVSRYHRGMSNIATYQSDMTFTAGTQLPRDNNGTCNDILKITSPCVLTLPERQYAFSLIQGYS